MVLALFFFCSGALVASNGQIQDSIVEIEERQREPEIENEAVQTLPEPRVTADLIERISEPPVLPPERT